MNASPSLTPAAYADRDRRIVAVLCGALPGLQAIYRYGSAGTLHERAESDIDLAVLAAVPFGAETLLQLAGVLGGLTGKDIDLHDMRRLPVTLRVRIVTEGFRLFAADRAASEEYDSRVLSDYAFLNEARRGILADIRARGRIHG